MKLTPEELEIIEVMFDLAEQQISWFREAYEARTGKEVNEDVFDNLLKKITKG